MALFQALWLEPHQGVQNQLDNGVVLELAHANDLAKRGDHDPKNGVGK